MTAFTSKTFGKWILSGEHAVLRGCPALVFPVPDCYLEMTYSPSPDPLSVDFRGQSGKEYNLLFWGLIEDALKRLGKVRSDLHGRIDIESSLPVGTGLGASAALCISLAKFFVSLGWLDEGEVYEFSRGLEDLFHGESSGVDIAVALSGRPLRFCRNGERAQISMNWQPHWYISYSGQRGVTSECVARVKSLFSTDLKKAEQLDRQMAESVERAEKALGMDREDGFPQLMQAIRLGETCFSQWGLIEGSLQAHIQGLKSAGAMACKPTGSGGGGFVLSLWDKEPSADIRDKFGFFELNPPKAQG